MMNTIGRVFYVGMISTDWYAQTIGQPIYSGAAARKMQLVALALRRVKRRAHIISLPCVGSSAGRSSYPAVRSRDGGLPIVFLRTLRSPTLRKLIGPLFLLVFFMRHARPSDTVVFYNHAFEYLPALMLLRVKGLRLVHDIEDAPIQGHRGLRGLMSRLSFRIIFSLTSARKMVVAEHVAEKLGLLDYVAIRGVASPEESIDHERTSAKWSQLEEGGTLLIHFGGTLISETGLDLFYDTVVHLMNHADLLVRDIKFQLTGIGNLEKIRALQEELAQSTRISVELLPGLSKRSYLEVIEACHASLSLKKPESELANTTFPSKVIEITSAGLALVTTRLGDVPKIFGENSAFFLEGYEPLQLAQVLIDMTNSPARVKAVAKAGREACMREFSLDMVGLQMNRLF